MNKPFLVFASSRSGTSILMRIIKTYSEERFNISEYFNINDYIIVDDNVKLKSVETENNKFENVDLEIDKRIQLLEKYYHKNIPIKLLSHQITDSIFDYVKDRYEIIIIERNDKYEQLLSWLISMHTNVWNLYHSEIFKQPEKFTVNLNMVDLFFKKQKEYKVWKERFLENSDIPIVYYEDLNADNNFKKIIENIGFNYDNRDILYPPQKLYLLSEKEKIIINVDEIKEYLKEINE